MDAFLVEGLIALLDCGLTDVTTTVLSLKHSVPHIVYEIGTLIERLIGNLTVILVTVTVDLVPDDHTALKTEIIGSPNDLVLTHTLQFIEELLRRNVIIPVFLTEVGHRCRHYGTILLKDITRLLRRLAGTDAVWRIGDSEVEVVVWKTSHVLQTVAVICLTQNRRLFHYQNFGSKLHLHTVRTKSVTNFLLI